ncbi:carbohydrate esterase family 8 protein [Sphaerobolus stellatus SS14]|uniref:Pectinesterase n=1 Tax=Sphaerobolus stellatus (strain SS14) TaxID=990650 RepID=A0A0C9W199_SPHS4|nr:carbohydrate esterase family 8 protein [Sphaerobolus stellatus SS14]
MSTTFSFWTRVLSLVLVLLSVRSVYTSPSPSLEKRASRTSAPSGAIVVRPSNPGSGEFTSVQAAVNSLPNDSSSRSIFIFSGTYNEQVTITRSGPLTIYGYTTDTSSYTSNTVTITQSKSAGQSGSDPTSATLIVNKANFQLYNVNLKNTFGQSSSNGQALAVSANGSKQGYYGVGFYSWQDTVLAETGVQFFGSCYIQGAVDFIFGQHAFAFFHKNTIASIGAGCITADGPTNSTDSIFVINASNIILGPNATSTTSGNVYLGRPWTSFARVVVSNSNLGSHINPAGWSIWSTSTPNTANVLFGEVGNTGAGASGTRASFSTKLPSTSGYTISSILGSDYTTWVDTAYST